MGKQILNNLSFWTSRRLPILLQTEAAECGVACICMIASYWGHKIDIATMRRIFSVSLKGVTLRSLMSMASMMNLQNRALKIDMNNLRNVNLPCIIHWNMNHFVVLRSLSMKHVVIHDPNVGERRLSLNNFGKHFTGVVLELRPTESFRKKEEKQVYSIFSLMGKISGLKYALLQLLLLGITFQIFSLVAPFYMQWIVDEALLGADRNLVTVLSCGFLLLVIFQSIVAAFRSWITTVISTSLNFQWLGNAFSHLLKLPLSYFEKRHTGDIVSRFSSIEVIQKSLTSQLVEGGIDALLVIGTFSMMLLYSPQLALIAFVSVMVYTVFRWIGFRKLREATAEEIIHSAKQQTHFMETVRGIQSIRLFGRDNERRSSWMNFLTDQFNAQLRISKISIGYQTINSLLFNSERIIIIWMAALAVLDNRFSVGMLFAFISYKDQFSQRSASLMDKIFEMKMLRLHGDRIADILLTEVESDTITPELFDERTNLTIELRNITFRYADGEPNILDNINLFISSKEFVAITGPSGSGKTTLMKIILGLLQPTHGEVLCGGVNIKHMGLENYRKLLGTVMQDDTLFAGSISENIAFFDPSSELPKIEEAAEASAILNEIKAMPMGFNTLIGDIGTGLSGGQKQRILLARALYAEPKFLILDEATSHLDIVSENAVNVAIKKISLTRIIVAHRPSTIQTAERIITLNHGRIVEEIIQRAYDVNEQVDFQVKPE